MRVRVLLFHFVCESLCVCTLNEGVCNNNLFLAVAYLGSTILWCFFSIFYYVCVYALDLFLCTVNSLFN